MLEEILKIYQGARPKAKAQVEHRIKKSLPGGWDWVLSNCDSYLLQFPKRNYEKIFTALFTEKVCCLYGNPRRFVGRQTGYKPQCGVRSCQCWKDLKTSKEYKEKHKISEQRRVQTIKEKYGVDSQFDIPEFKEHRKKESIRKFGTTWPSQNLNVRSCIRNTIINKINSESEYYQKLLAARRNHIPVDTLLILDNVTEFAKQLSTFGVAGLAQKLSVCETTILNYHHRYNLKIVNFGSSSSYETEIANWLTSLDCNFIHHDHTICKPKEIDFFLPDYNLAIEFQGDYWHLNPGIYSAEFIHPKKGKASDVWKYDAAKAKICESKGIKLFQIWESEWNSNKKEIKQQILDYINISKDVK